jgi:Type IX secretion system membrane protein PorP/SprF
MKKNFLWAILLIGIFITLSGKIYAQQIPLYSQYFANPFIYNPAWAGLDKFGSVNITHRNQWDGIEGAPVTNLITVDLPFLRIQKWLWGQCVSR